MSYRTVLLASMLLTSCTVKHSTSATISTTDNWISNRLKAKDGTEIILSYSIASENLPESQELVAKPIWVNITLPAGRDCSAKVRAVVINYYDSSNVPANKIESQQEVDLVLSPRPESRCEFYAELKPIRLSSSHIGYGYNFRQEIAIVVDGQWLVDPVNGSNNFKFKADVI